MDFFEVILSAVERERNRSGNGVAVRPEVFAEFMAVASAVNTPAAHRNRSRPKTASENAAAKAPLSHSNPPLAAKPAPAADLSAIATCRRCRLCEKRVNSVPGEGVAGRALLMFVGETPGMEEDKQGKPFVGAAGELLTKMIAAMKFHRDEVYLTHLVKCRPPYSRDAQSDEIGQCRGFLDLEIDAVQPKVIVFFGASNAKAILGGDSVDALRRQWFTYRGIHCIATHSPTYLLRHAEAKRAVWEDLQLVMAAFGRQ